MGFTVEQECPQCGAPIELDEADHLLLCPYCGVNSFLFTSNYFRYILPDKASDKDIIYAPYLRFRGAVYFVKDFTIGHRIVDITHVGLESNAVPASLGLRPQAMKMKFVTPEIKGAFLRFSLKAADILTKAGKLSMDNSRGQILHRAFIGETMSIIYLPTYIEGNRLFDAVLNRPISILADGTDSMAPNLLKKPRWKITFIPTLCPQCGWNLECERDSVVMSCKNCDSAWEAVDGKFVRAKSVMVPCRDENSLYLPFWKISARTEGVKIDTFSDFIKITNQPRVLGDEWENKGMSFWSPAFKIRPKLFLNLARQFTISQALFKEEETIPSKNNYPVTLPRSEALQSLKMILSASTVTKKNVLPFLPRVRFGIKESTLVYLPFLDTGHDLVQEDTGISVNKKGLEFGRKL